MKSSHILKVPQFSKTAPLLRQEFDARFSNPLVAHRGRFVWDHWNVPGQYNLLRTPAFEYFDQKIYMRFHKELVLWGRRTLGCWDISPPWMSCYIEGCKQELHSDVPHGPWAFVFSLSPQHPKYSGGETLILKPDVLNYWKNFLAPKDRELSSFVDKIPAKFNQLTVFDPRYPHSVTEVRGTNDPREGRLVIHGWFTEPKTYIEGYLPGKATEKILNEAYARVVDLILAYAPTQGVMSLQLKVSATGRVTGMRWGTQNLLNLEGRRPQALTRQIEKLYLGLKFPKAKGPTAMTVPLIVS
jgi:hypothetical protein